MRAVGALLGVAVAIAAVWVALAVLRGRPAPTAPPAGSARSADAGPPSSIEAPLPAEEETRRNLDRRRLPFYRLLRDQYADVVLRFGVTGDLDTLDLVVTQADDATVNGLISSVVAPNAKAYGFRRVRFFVRSPRESVDPLTLVAEASQSDAGVWTTWRK